MNNTPECIITGCVLYVFNEEKFAYGDLHKIGDCLIFNAVLNEDGQAHWQYKFDAKDQHRMVTVNSDKYFERRGVIVFSVKNTAFNETARKYLAM
jgi:hypothetical protein